MLERRVHHANQPQRDSRNVGTAVGLRCLPFLLFLLEAILVWLNFIVW